MAKNQYLTIEEYNTEMDSIISQMMTVLVRAQRKMDDMEYKNILKKN